MATKKKPDELTSQVNSAISSQVAPVNSAIKNAGTQYTQEQSGINQISGALNKDLTGIANQTAARSGDLLNLAAQQNTASQDNLNRNLDFLRSVLGDHGDFGGASTLAQAQSQFDNVGNATGQGLGAQALTRDLATMQGAQVAKRGEDLRSSRLGYNQRRTQLQDQLNAIKATAPLLRRQFMDENLKNNLLLEQAALDKQVAQWNHSNDLATQAYNTDALNAQVGATANKNKVKPSQWGLGINADFDQSIGTIYQAWNNNWQKAVNGGHYGTPFQRAFQALGALSISPAQQALLAGKWVGYGNMKKIRIDHLKSYLDSQNLNSAAQAKLLVQVYGKNWKNQLNKITGDGPYVTTSGPTTTTTSHGVTTTIAQP